MKKLLFSKKASDGDAFEFGNQLPEIIFMITIIIILITVLLFVLSFMKSHHVTVPEETYYYTYISRFLYSPNCFASSDLGGGYSSGLIIDYELFTDPQLHNCFVTDEYTEFAFQLRLSGNFPDKIISTKNYYDKSQTTLLSNVAVLHGEDIFPGKLFISIDN